MKHIKKIILILSVITISASLLSACAKKSENLLSEDNVDAQRGGVIMRNMKIGKVVSVNGNNVEILLANMPDRENMPSEGGQRVQGERPQGERPQNGERPQGGQRIQGGQAGAIMRNMEFSDQTAEITIPDDVQIIYGDRDSQVVISPADLEPEDIISYSEEDGIIASVRLMEIHAN